jgi:hypothetical protein
MIRLEGRITLGPAHRRVIYIINILTNALDILLKIHA